MARYLGPDMFFTGEMNGKMVTRQGRLLRLFEGPIALIQAVDGPQHWPRRFFVRAWDFERYYTFLARAWAKNQAVPFEFALQKPMGIDFAAEFGQCTLEQQHQILDSMRSAEILPVLRALNVRTLPRGLNWSELKSIYLKQAHEF